jgi:glucose-fructose oxidoreductase
MNKSISRREIVKTISVGSAALFLSPANLLSACQPSQKRGLGVALVGLGYYSTDLLAPALQMTKNCYLAGIVTGTPSKAEAWKQKYNIPDKNIYNYSNFDSIANNPDIDVVYVVLPPSMHREYVVRAAAAGKHVWCEKPMAPTAKECQEMIDACKKVNRSLAIGYRLQHEPPRRPGVALYSKNNWVLYKNLVVRQVTATTARTTGNKSGKWAVVYWAIWGYMPSREQGWAPVWSQWQS